MTTRYVLSEIGIDWKVASISCDTDDYSTTGYSPCSTSDTSVTCGKKSDAYLFGWMSIGDNTDLTSVDMPVIGIFDYGWSTFDSKFVTIYQSDNCTGPSASADLFFVDFDLFADQERNLHQELNLYYDTQNHQVKVPYQIDELASIRVSSGVEVNLYSEYNWKPAPF